MVPKSCLRLWIVVVVIWSLWSKIVLLGLMFVVVIWSLCFCCSHFRGPD